MTTRPRTLLLRGDQIYAPGPVPSTAVLVHNDRIGWVGTEDGADGIDADETVHLGGRLVTPAFVDSHVHATATGLALTGLDLAGAASLAEALARVGDHADRHPDVVLLGSGWDDSTWPERRPPTRAELDIACRGRAAYLTRVDVHSALASSALLADAPAAYQQSGAPRDDDDAQLRLSAHHVVREKAMASVTSAQRADAQSAAMAHAAGMGIGLLVEMAGPRVSSEADLASLLDLARRPGTVDVAAYWGQLGEIGLVQEWGLAGAGGDLFADGAIGSRTAALDAPYTDDPTAGHGHLWFDADAVADHVHLCTTAGVQAGFHAIGDRAVRTVVTGIELVADRWGAPAVRRLRHRVEHCEMLDDDLVRRMAALGLIASVQPVFDRLWGGDRLLYAARLGERAATLNPFATLAAAGVTLAFGSDAPVTPLDGWAAVHAAVRHHTPTERVSARLAMTAATRGGRQAIGAADDGVLRPGAVADLAVWEATGLAPGRLPDGVVGEVFRPPACVATIVGGVTVHRTDYGPGPALH